MAVHGGDVKARFTTYRFKGTLQKGVCTHKTGNLLPALFNSLPTAGSQ